MEATGDEVELDQDNGISKFMKEIRLQGLQAYSGGCMEYLLKCCKKLSIITEEVKGDDRIGFVYGTKSIREEDVDKNAVQESCSVTDHDPLQKCTIAGNIETKKVVVDKKRRIRHYTNRQKILLVGEGDFSFASCLATAFGSASNLIATSLDSKDTVISRYSNGEDSLRNLEERGAVVIHEVDVHTMNNHPELKNKLFDRIVFNFPHAGGTLYRVRESESWYIECHKQVVSCFFKAARYMLSKDGEIHVTHKTAHPFEKWDIVKLAKNLGLVPRKEVVFCRFDYPGYVNKKAYGLSWDDSFPVGQAATFMFARR